MEKLEKLAPVMVSIFENKIHKHSKAIDILQVIDLIKSDPDLEIKTNILRFESNPKKKEELKGQLQAVTFSGLFDGQRKTEYLNTYSNFICLDLDDVSDIDQQFQKICEDEYTFASFISPSGTGIKVLIRTNNIPKDHLKVFNQMDAYYENVLQLKIDPSGKDLPRLTYLCSDPKIFVNKNAKVWDKTKMEFYSLVRANNKNFTFTEGSRNDYVFNLAVLCQRKSLQMEAVCDLMVNFFATNDFDAKEIEKAISSAFSGNYHTSGENANLNKGLNNWERAEIYLTEKFDFRLNIVSQKYEYKKKNEIEFIDLNENTIYREMQKENIGFSRDKLAALLGSDFVPLFDPFKDYFYSLLLDDKSDYDPIVDYIGNLAEFIPTRDPKRFVNHLRKMLVRCVACSTEEKVFNKQVFILVNDEQGSGKSSFCRWLVPPALSNYLAENIGTDKDSLITLATSFIINMDELSTLSRTELNSLKSVISKDKVNLRLPFAKRATTMWRRANFVGSTNKDEFLTDETGSVRWLCFELTGKIDFSYREKINIDHIYRQAIELYLKGFKYELNREEIEENERINVRHQEISLEYELISKYFYASTKVDGGDFMTSTDITIYINKEHSNYRLSKNQVGKALKYLGFKKESNYIGEFGYSKKGYYVKINTVF